MSLKWDTIVLGDNDLEFALPLAKQLVKEGFRVFHEKKGGSVYTRTLDIMPGLVLIDSDLPGTTGFDLCRMLRPEFKGMILFLSSKDTELDQILAFELGADDFVLKSVTLQLLMARVHALVRRWNHVKENEMKKHISIGPLTVDAARREANLNGKALVLTTLQFDLLWYLVTNAGKVVSRDDLCQAIYHTEYNGIDRSIDIYISRIRQKLGDDPSNPVYLKTVRGTGYLFAGERS